jgi:hypothetical protein
MQKLILADVRKATHEQIGKQQTRYSILFTVSEVLAAFDGKKITERFTNKLREQLPMYIFSLSEMKESHRYLRVWRTRPSGTGAEDIASVFIGTGTGIMRGTPDTECFDYQRWKANNENALDTITQSIAQSLEALRQSEITVNAYNHALAEYEKAKEGLEGLVVS